MKKTIFLCGLSIFLFISREKSIASSIETSSWYQFPPYFPASKMLDDSFTFTYDLPFLVPYNSSWNTRENKRFQQEWLTHYINSKKLIEELMYQCSKNTENPQLQKRCQKDGMLLQKINITTFLDWLLKKIYKDYLENFRKEKHSISHQSIHDSFYLHE